MNRLVLVNNGLNATGSQQLDTGDKGKENQFLYIIIILIVIIIIIGLLAMFIIIRRGRLKIKEFVPEGRIEPLEDVEARLKPALAAGTPIQHAQLAPAPGATAGARFPGLPPATVVPGTPTPTAAPMPLPAAGAAAGPSVNVPALPPANAQYGLYSPQAPAAQPVNLDQRGGYQF